MTHAASQAPSWPTKAPPGATPEAAPPGSLLPGEKVLAIEKFDDPSIFGGPDQVTLRHAVAVGSGFAVIGDVWHGVGATSGRAWLSPDGRSWERVDVPAMDRAFVINDFAATAEGTLVAIGIGDAVAGALIWSSSDGGRTWQSTRIKDVANNMQLSHVVAGPRGFVMVGSTSSIPARDGDMALWWSPDGQRWTRAAMPRDVFGDVSINAIGATPSGFVAVGGRWPAGEMSLSAALAQERGAAWRSADGLHWIEADVPDAPALRSVIVSEFTMLAAGFHVTDPQPSWWRSEDGRAWQPVRWPDLWGPTASPQVFGWRSSFYQLGTDWGSGGPVLELWASEDGRSWRETGATLESRIGGEVVAGEPGILMRGERDGAGVLWLISWPVP